MILPERLRGFTRTGHRGARGLAPENTLVGFERGLAHGVDMLELDVRLSKDGQVVVIHDALLDRTTDGAGPVAERSYAELARLDAGHRFTRDGDPCYRGAGVTIPRLVDVLDAFPGALLTVEVKARAPELVARVVELVRARAADRVVLASADHATLRALRAAAPELPTSCSGREVRDLYLLSRVGLAGWLFRSPAALVQAPFWSNHDEDRGLRLIDARFVRAVHAGGRKLHVWTVNDVPTMRALIALGVDGITTDRPDLLAEALVGAT